MRKKKRRRKTNNRKNKIHLEGEKKGNIFWKEKLKEY
jgi:hypothetical protein